jgi:hypothetical protein
MTQEFCNFDFDLQVADPCDLANCLWDMIEQGAIGDKGEDI